MLGNQFWVTFIMAIGTSAGATARAEGGDHGGHCPNGMVQWIAPTDGAVDARQFHSLTNILPLVGIDLIRVMPPAGGGLLHCWSLCETAQIGPPNDIIGINDNGGGIYTLKLLRPITPGATTTITYLGDPTMGDTGGDTGTHEASCISHPSNTDGDAHADETDAKYLMDCCLTGGCVPAPSPLSCDINHSSAYTAEDLIRLCDLFNGAGAFDPWYHTPRPEAPCDNDPTGACCSFLHPVCRLLSALRCEELGGTFHGVGTTCAGDCNNDGTPNICESDCDHNGLSDDCEIAAQTAFDCDGNGVLNQCDRDCNQNQFSDECELFFMKTPDCNQNHVPDECDVASGFSKDCDGQGTPDECDIRDCPATALGCADCNRNKRPDGCDIALGFSKDCDDDHVPDECERCPIPGDLTGDGIVNDVDVPPFMGCENDPCFPANCVCADMDGDGDVDQADSTLHRMIVAGQMPQQTMAILDFTPKSGSPGDVIKITGIGFGNNPDNLCIVAMDKGAPTAIPFQGLDIGGNMLFARVGALDNGDRPAPLMIAQGRGAFGPLPPMQNAIMPQGGWRWIFQGGPIAVFDHFLFPFPFFPIPTFSCFDNVITADVVDGKLCLTLDKPCVKGADIEIFCRAWDHTPDPDFGVDGYIPSLIPVVDLPPEQCAATICAAVEALYLSQTPPVDIDCDEVVQNDGSVKITLSYPNRTIDWGRFSIGLPYVEMQTNNTLASNDDYVTWSPTYSRARAVGLTAMANPMDVVLTNDNPADIPTGGNVRFAAYVSPWPAATTATLTELPLTLPVDGSWVDYVVAGEYGSPSTNDKDTIIEAHAEVNDGPICGAHCLMVRVRKNANDLTAGERDRYVNAILDLHAAGDYEVFQDIHAVASSQGHGSSAFLPWHRAFVLEYERALQEHDASVAAHYWDATAAAANVFGVNFMGTNTPPSGDVTTGPFATWTIDGMTPIVRGSGSDHTGLTGVQSDATTLAPLTFASFKVMEGNPHGSAHVWVGGWM